ncbi:MAG: S8 family serine peptidase, partial [Planctomycetota bacterium]
VMTEPQSRADLAEAIVSLASRADARHVVVQFDRPISDQERAQLAEAGVTLLGYLSDYAFFASVSPHRADGPAAAAVAPLATVLPIERDWKLHPDLQADIVHDWMIADQSAKAVQRREAEAEGGDPARPAEDLLVAVYVLFHPDVPLDPDAVNLVWRHGARVVSHLRSVNGLVIELPVSEIKPLAEQDEVQWLEPPLPKFSELNDSNRERVGADIVHQAPYGLDGAGVSVLVYDAGYGLASHQDFGGRLTPRDSSGLGDHATHVSGTVGGSGVGSGGTYKGMAPAVTIESYGFEQEGGLQQGFLYTDPGDIEEDYGEAITVYGVDIANNSIGTNTAPNGFPCDWEGNYGVTGALIDSIAGGFFGEPFRIVWANGNERGSGRCGTTYHTTAPPACAKNHITVGAMNSNDDSVTSFTSWGYTDDGRIKPDVSAPGCQSNDDFGVTSCSSSGSYNVKCGTSMASPTVCGLGALLIQDFRDQFVGEPDPRNSTLKILFAHTAEDIEEPGPDYKTGYGSVRIQPAVDLLRSGNFLEDEVSQGETFQVLVVVNPGDPEARVTLAWDDVPGIPDTMPVLVNDLDLRVFDSSSTQYYPFTLDPDNPSVPAVQTQEDHENNIEQVIIDAPAPGAYRIEVYGFNVPQGPQSFSLTATPLLVACSPQGIVSLDRIKYPCQGSTATIQVVDCDLNTDDLVVESVDVTIARHDGQPRRPVGRPG